MANAQKYTRAACGHLAAHYERRKDEKGEYVKFGNQDIDPQKTNLNYNLAPRRELSKSTLFDRERQKPVPSRGRCECHVFMGGYSARVPPPQPKSSCKPRQRAGRRLFLSVPIAFSATATESRMSYRRMSIRTKKRRICTLLSCRLQRTRSEGRKVSAKEVITKNDLKTFHTDLERYLDSFRDWHLKWSMKPPRTAIRRLPN